MECYLSINFMPNGLAASPQTLDNTLSAAEGCGFPIDRIILEVTEGEMIQDMRRFAHDRSLQGQGHASRYR